MDSNHYTAELSKDRLVHLNVGGHYYTSTVSTLSKSPVLQRMLAPSSHLCPSLLDDSGRLFIDRNGDAFAIILEFLRTSRIIFTPAHSSPSHVLSERLILAEFDFFGLPIVGGLLGRAESDAVERAVRGESLDGAVISSVQDAAVLSPMQKRFNTSVIPVWIRQVLIPFMRSNKKAPYYTETPSQDSQSTTASASKIGKYSIHIRGKLGSFSSLSDSDSFFRIHESQEGYLAFNAHNIDVSRAVMDVLVEFLGCGADCSQEKLGGGNVYMIGMRQEARDVFREDMMAAGGFGHVSFGLCDERVNGVITHSMSLIAFV